ncbi:unnamed protein product [Clonostachys rosea]|uniref:Berberine/berberine-like domain-containing protein n=1 Tax=Bionectria ochroleuca TaxID=29856 RepID=A0ABY6UEM2_BIOOC|nr:unnamed protein product [Clonostachys rosea]
MSPITHRVGLAADNALEFEVVTTDGRHLTASATENSDLYWALSGGGPGNYDVVLSLTTKAYADGPTAGATLAFINTDPDKYWKAIGAFQSRLLALDEIHGFATSWGLDNRAFSVDVATLPNGTQSDLTDAYRQIAESPQFPVKRISGNSVSVYRQRIYRDLTRNAVLPAWKDALYTMSVGVQISPDLSSAELAVVQQQVNKWQDLFRPLRPGGGAYVSEATFDNPNWKEDYFGRNYDRLLEIKMKYDPNFALWQHISVGADAYWKVTEAGRLCRVP